MDVVDRLLSLGADTEVGASRNVTALMRASREGRIDVVDRLLAAGANVNAFTMKETTALIYAASEGHVAIIDRLVVHGATFNHRTDLTGKNALIVACEYRRIDVVDRLLSFSCDVNAQDFEGGTALVWACSKRETLRSSDSCLKTTPTFHCRVVTERGPSISLQDGQRSKPSSMV